MVLRYNLAKQPAYPETRSNGEILQNNRPLWRHEITGLYENTVLCYNFAKQTAYLETQSYGKIPGNNRPIFRHGLMILFSKTAGEYEDTV